MHSLLPKDNLFKNIYDISNKSSEESAHILDRCLVDIRFCEQIHFIHGRLTKPYVTLDNASVNCINKWCHIEEENLNMTTRIGIQPNVQVGLCAYR